MSEKWIKSIDGTLYNLSFISSFYWTTNMSATSDYRFELHAGGPDMKDIVCKCSNESDKMMVSSNLEKFIQSDDKMFVFPKL